jgi:serine/threonine-protein kinase
MKRFLHSDRFFGVVVTLLVLGSYLSHSSLLETVELKFYDVRARLRENTAQKPHEIAIVAIDDDSISQLGRWPWPRSRIAAMVEKLSTYQPKVIGLNVLFSAPESDPGIAALNDLATQYRALLASKTVVERDPANSPVRGLIEAEEKKLDQDAQLAAALKDKKVVLPLFFEIGPTLGAKPKDLPMEITRAAMTMLPNPMGQQNDVTSEKITFPLVSLAGTAAGLGHTNFFQDVDGSVRRMPMAVSYGNIAYPSFALELVRVYLGLQSKDLGIVPATKVTVGQIEAPLDQNGSINVTYRGPENTFPNYSFVDVLNDKVNSDVFKDRIVLLGITAIAQAPRFVTPAGANFSDTELTANVVESLLNTKFLTQPAWAAVAELSLTLVIGIFVTLLVPRLKTGTGAGVSFILIALMLGAGTWLFVAQSQWLKVTYPSVLLATGYTVVVSKRFLTAEKRNEAVDASQVETNKTTLPTEQDALKAADDEAMFDESLGRTKDAAILTEVAGMKPILGCYEVEKELGRGAMGIVYQAKDTNVDRHVAVKSMTLELEGTPEQAREMKMRFFREAESAGNLNHPNTVRIFDSVIEGQTAYIVMELLEGHDLKRYCDRNTLLSLETVLEYCAKVADALDYAHRAGVIHRDIKPTNIMLLEDGTLRITDFGIARIAASSKTGTGTAMASPYYMSPEQVSGKKVDGRADLWSLGVTMYEMTTGEKPFKSGDSIGTLLFQIANDTPPPPTTYRIDLPADVVAIIDTCLKKNPDKRYQRGSDLAVDLRRVMERVKKGGKPPISPVTTGPDVQAVAATTS